MVDLPVLVLNSDYRPLHISTVRRAVVLMLKGKAEIMENGVGEIHTPSFTLPIPSVIRLLFFVHLPHKEKRITRFEVFNRDRFTCQYCGKQTLDLTLDHIVPRHRGGEHRWENVVSACIPCNRKKAGRTPWEAGMKLLRHPQPPPHHFAIPYFLLQNQPQWHKFL